MTTKTNRHDITASTHPDHPVFDRAGLHAITHQVTKEENELYKILRQNTHDSIWGCAIRKVTKEVGRDGGIPRFRKLIEQLQSQAKDCPESMKIIIGERAYGLLFFDESNIGLTGLCSHRPF